MKYSLDKFLRVVHIVDPASYGAAAVAYSTAVDTRGYREALFIVSLGVITATGDVNFLVQESADDSTYAAVTGATIAEKTVTEDSATFCIRVDCTKRMRYLRLGYDVDDDAAIFGAVCVLGDPSIRPATASATVETSV